MIGAKKYGKQRLFQTVRQCTAMAGSDSRGARKGSPVIAPLGISRSNRDNKENKENSMDSGNKERLKSESEVWYKGGAPDPVVTKVHHFSGC